MSPEDGLTGRYARDADVQEAPDTGPENEQQNRSPVLFEQLLDHMKE